MSTYTFTLPVENKMSSLRVIASEFWPMAAPAGRKAPWNVSPPRRHRLVVAVVYSAADPDALLDDSLCVDSVSVPVSLTLE